MKSTAPSPSIFGVSARKMRIGPPISSSNDCAQCSSEIPSTSPGGGPPRVDEMPSSPPICSSTAAKGSPPRQGWQYRPRHTRRSAQFRRCLFAARTHHATSARRRRLRRPAPSQSPCPARGSRTDEYNACPSSQIHLDPPIAHAFLRIHLISSIVVSAPNSRSYRAIRPVRE